jgi:hypothetical protein
MLNGTSTDTLWTLHEKPAMVLVSAVGVTDALTSPVDVLPRTSWSLAWDVIVASRFLAVEGDHPLAIEVEDQRGLPVALHRVQPHPVALDAGRLRAVQVADDGRLAGGGRGDGEVRGGRSGHEAGEHEGEGGRSHGRSSGGHRGPSHSPSGPGRRT